MDPKLDRIRHRGGALEAVSTVSADGKAVLKHAHGSKRFAQFKAAVPTPLRGLLGRLIRAQVDAYARARNWWRGQQFEYAFEDIGNRISTKAGGDQTGANLRTATYTATTLNQPTNRPVPGAADVLARIRGQQFRSTPTRTCTDGPRISGGNGRSTMLRLGLTWRGRGLDSPPMNPTSNRMITP